MKKIIYVGVFVLLSVMAFSISENDIITQTELNKVDVDTLDIQCQWDRNSFSIQDANAPISWIYPQETRYIYVEFNCLTVQRSGRNYEVIRKDSIATYPLGNLYQYIRVGYSRNDLMIVIYDEFVRQTYRMKRIMKDFQTSSQLDDNIGFDDIFQ